MVAARDVKVGTATPPAAHVDREPRSESPAHTAAIAEAEAIAAQAAAEAAAEFAAEAIAVAASAARVSNTAAIQSALDAEEGLGSTTASATPLDRATAAATAVASSSVNVELAGSFALAPGVVPTTELSWDASDAKAIVTSAATLAVAVATITVAVAAAAAAAASAAIDAATLIDGQLGRNVAAGAAAAVARAISEHASEVARVALDAPGDPAAAVAVAASAAAAVARAIAAGEQLVPPTAPPAPRSEGREASAAVRTERSPEVQAVPARTEWASMLADPLLPVFDAGLSERPASLASPAEQGLWRDITLTRRLELMLRENEADFQVAFQNAPVALLVVGLPTGRPAHFLRVNPALSALTGYAQARLLDLGFRDLVHPQQRAVEQVPPSMHGIAVPEPHEGVHRWVHADGHDLWVLLRTATVTSGSGSVGQLVCEVEDVTARLAAEKALRSSEARFRLAFASAPQPAVLIELGSRRPGRLFAANRAACRMFGRSEFEVTWLDLESLAHRSDRRAVRELLRGMSSGQIADHEGEYSYQTPDGTTARFDLSAQVVAGPDGLPEHAVAYLRETAPR